MTTYYTSLMVSFAPGIGCDNFVAALDKVFAAIKSDKRVSTVDIMSEDDHQAEFFFTAERADESTAPNFGLALDLLKEGFAAAPVLSPTEISPQKVDDPAWAYVPA